MISLNANRLWEYLTEYFVVVGERVCVSSRILITLHVVLLNTSHSNWIICGKVSLSVIIKAWIMLSKSVSTSKCNGWWVPRLGCTYYQYTHYTTGVAFMLLGLKYDPIELCVHDINVVGFIPLRFTPRAYYWKWKQIWGSSSKYLPDGIVGRIKGRGE